MARKRGPKADHPNHPLSGEPIEYLYKNTKKDGSIKNYFFYNRQGKQISATSDIWKAIKKYSAYYDEKKTDLIEIPESAQSVPVGFYGEGYYGSIHYDNYVSPEWIIQEFQRLLAENRKLVVDVSGNPKYWDFENTPPKPPSLTCEEVLQEYLNLPREKPLNYDYKYKMKRHWKHFQRIIGKSFIRDITFMDIKRYRLTIQTQAEIKEKTGEIKRKNMWVNERFQSIHDVISKMIKTQEYKTDLNNLLQHLDQCIKVDEGKTRAKALTKEQWDIFYRHSESNLFIRCGLLLGLNCAMTWGDIIDLTLQNFDLEKQTYTGTRSKNDIQNCAMLFPETVQAIQNYIKENPTIDKQGRIFYYKPVMRKSLIDETLNRFKNWKETLKKSELKKVSDITHKHLRKSLQTTARKAHCHIEYIKLVMGRRLEGVEEGYTEKDAKMTTEVIKAVHDFYLKDKDSWDW